LVFAALLDTCVLWPSLQRDFLLSLAVEGLYRPVWSSAILAELEYEEAAKWVRRGADKHEAACRASRLISRMRTAFDDAEVSGWEALDGTYGLPDPDIVLCATFDRVNADLGKSGIVGLARSSFDPGGHMGARKRQRLLRLAERQDGAGRWERMSSEARKPRTLLRLEAKVSTIVNAQPLLMPGLVLPSQRSMKGVTSRWAI
jgi:hypothetical protein